MRILTTLMMFLCFSCQRQPMQHRLTTAAPATAPSHANSALTKSSADSDQSVHSYYVYDQSPVDFLASLVRAGPSDLVLVENAPDTWLTEEAVKALVLSVRSTTPCAPVVSAYCSRSLFGPSTEGREALFMIEGHLQKRYPPRLASDRVQLTPAEAEHLFSQTSPTK